MNAALDILTRVPSILIFLAALTVVSECCAASGLFDALANRIVSAARGRIGVAWSMFLAAACLVTAFLSLDTTAVLMTSAAVTVARRLDRPVALFALPTLWCTNMASMWLPVSNLTTLLARDVLPEPSALGYVKLSWPVALVSTAVPLLCATVIYRGELRGRVAHGTDLNLTNSSSEAAHRALRDVAIIVAAMSAALLAIEPAIAATVAAVACWIVVARRLPERRSEIRVPWSSLRLTLILFGAVALLHGLGALTWMTTFAGRQPAWLLSLIGGAAANGVNNLPAYLALEPAAHGQSTRLLALLVGVNIASGLTWWGSMGTLLWRDRLRRADIEIPLRTHLALTGGVTVATTAASLATLTLTR